MNKQTQNQSQVVAENTLILELHVRGPMFKKGVSSKRIIDQVNGNGNGNGASEADAETENGDINPDRIHITKDLINLDELQALRKLNSKFTEKLKFHTLPTQMLAHGLYRIPRASMEQTDELIEEFKAARSAELEKLRVRWPELVAQAQKDLGREFNPADYPTFDSIVAAHSVDSAYFSADLPTDVKMISRTIYEREKAKQEVQLRSAYQDIIAGLRIGFAQLVDTFARQLGKDETTGKYRKLFDSTFEKMNLFFDTFGARSGSVGGDAELQKLVDQARDLMKGVGPKMLKKSEAARDSLQTSFAEIASTVSQMVEVKGRKFSLDSDV